MNPEEYRRIIREDNVLDFGTLTVTKEQLERAGFGRLVSEIERIIKFNKIEKPVLHNKLINHETDYYKIDMDTNDIEVIVSMFGDLEVDSLGLNYEPTRSASFYASMLDKWNELPDYR